MRLAFSNRGISNRGKGIARIGTRQSRRGPGIKSIPVLFAGGAALLPVMARFRSASGTRTWGTVRVTGDTIWRVQRDEVSSVTGAGKSSKCDARYIKGLHRDCERDRPKQQISQGPMAGDRRGNACGNQERCRGKQGRYAEQHTEQKARSGSGYHSDISHYRTESLCSSGSRGWRSALANPGETKIAHMSYDVRRPQQAC